MARARTWAGLTAAVTGAFLLFDPAQRVQVLLHNLPRVAVVLLLALALVMTVQLLPYRAPAVLAGAFAAGAAVLLFGWPAVPVRQVAGAVPVLVLATGSALVVRASGPGGRHLSVLFVRTVRAAPGALGERTELACAAGGLYFDARPATLRGPTTIRVWMVAAEVVVMLPREWRCELASANLRGVAVLEDGRPPAQGPVLRLEATGRLGRLVIRRV